MSKLFLIFAAVFLTGVLAGGPGPCDVAVAVTAPFFPEAITTLETALSDVKIQLDDFRLELEANQLTSDDYYNHSEAIQMSFNGKAIQVINHIAQQVGIALGISTASVRTAMSTSQADSRPLSCILEQLIKVVQKYYSVQKESSDIQNELLERFKDLFKP